jgi:hypothetical protein
MQLKRAFLFESLENKSLDFSKIIVELGDPYVVIASLSHSSSSICAIQLKIIAKN